MTEIIVSIENDRAIDSIINAIKMLKGCAIGLKIVVLQCLVSCMFSINSWSMGCCLYYKA